MELIVYQGRKYTKFGNYFRASRHFLHRVIWTDAFGEIPQGFHVHHKDGNPSNNALENLECVNGKAHISSHQKGHNRIPFAAIKAAAIWAKTEAGVEALKKSGRENAHFMHDPRALQCTTCGSNYIGIKRNENAFCSNACKSRYRRKSGVDNITKKCRNCGSEFQSSKYQKVNHCSKRCAGIARWAS